MLHSDAWLGARLTFPEANGAPLATLTLTGTPLTRARFRPGLRRQQQFSRMLVPATAGQDGWEGSVGSTPETMRHRPPAVGCPASHADADTDPKVRRQHILP